MFPMILALAGGVGGAKLANGLATDPPRWAGRRGQYRRRFRASRAACRARSRHRDVHARRPEQCRDRLGPRRRDLAVHGGARRARRRNLVQSRRSRSRPPMSSARAG
ncbi:MAG: hypothetical protein WDO24_23850 [Pseudomonadota bacterium]